MLHPHAVRFLSAPVAPSFLGFAAASDGMPPTLELELREHDLANTICAPDNRAEEEKSDNWSLAYSTEPWSYNWRAAQ